MIKRILGAGGAVCAVSLFGCTSYPFLPGTWAGNNVAGAVATFGREPFVQNVVQARTFIGGRAVTTVIYRANDITRTPWGIDFNNDGRVDPVAAYAQGPVPAGGVIQILLSDGPSGYISLTLDGNNGWQNLADVKVADIDGDGAPDIIAATSKGVVYLRNPGPGLTTRLRDWGSSSPDREFLAGSSETLTVEEIEAIIRDLVPPGSNAADYEIKVEQGYTHVEVGDIDGDGFNDVVASRRLKIEMQPRDGSAGEPIVSVTGSIQVFINPGNAVDGQNWQLFQVGRHERYTDLDRQGAAMTVLFDIDGDGDLDIVSAAREDDNVAISWFENPGADGLFSVSDWTQWRVGSIRDAYAIDVADLTGNGRVDVVASGREQQQIILFEQPATGPKREYDWDSHAIVTFRNFKPLDIKAIDLDLDGVTELVVGGDGGQIRWFEPGSNPRAPWNGARIADLSGGGAVGLLGYGDLDGDGRVDLIAVQDANDDNDDQLVWIRNVLR